MAPFQGEEAFPCLELHREGAIEVDEVAERVVDHFWVESFKEVLG